MPDITPDYKKKCTVGCVCVLLQPPTYPRRFRLLASSREGRLTIQGNCTCECVLCFNIYLQLTSTYSSTTMSPATSQPLLAKCWPLLPKNPTLPPSLPLAYLISRRAKADQPSCRCVCVFFFHDLLQPTTTMGPASLFSLGGSLFSQIIQPTPSLPLAYPISQRSTNHPSRTIQGGFVLSGAFVFKDLFAI